MKARVFSSSNDFLGRFDVADPAAVPAAFPEFKSQHPLQAHDYVECAGLTWTLMPGPGGLQLVPGRIEPSDSSAASPARSGAPSDTVLHERRGDTIRTLGVITGSIAFLVLFVTGSSRRDLIEVLLVAAFIAAFSGGLLYALGVLIKGQALLLKALSERSPQPSSRSAAEGKTSTSEGAC